MLHLQSKTAESVIWERKLVETSKRPSMYGAIFASSLDEVSAKVARLKFLPTVSEVQSIRDLIPEDQDEKLTLLRSMRPILAGIGPLQPKSGPVSISQLGEVLGRIHFKMLESSQSQRGVPLSLEHR